MVFAQTDWLKAAEDRFVRVNDLRFHYRSVGDPAAPPVVMLHGIMGHSREWDVLVESLAAQAHVVVVDQRGHGETEWAEEYTASVMAHDLIALIERIGLARPQVIGHSMGGMVAMLAAVRRPDLIERMAIIDIGPDSINGDFAAGLAGFVKALGSSSYDSIDDAYAEWSDNPLAQPALLRHYVEHCLHEGNDGRLEWRFDGRGLVRFFQGVSEPELWDAVDRIACPVLLVQGEHSPVLSSGTAAQMLRRLANGRLVVIADGGHDLGVEQPEAIADAVQRFFARELVG